MKNIAIIGCGGVGFQTATTITQEDYDYESELHIVDEPLPIPPELGTFEITNPYKEFGGLGMYEDKPSKNQLKKCQKGLHLYNQKNECVRCGKKLNL